MRRRLDVELVRRGLAPSRARATEAIAAGRVTVAGSPASSPARQVDAGEPIRVAPEPDEFVSRGGKKLVAALEQFAIDVSGRRCLDVGASTGGFTDCLLQRDADHVVALDVGRGQLHWKLRTDPRVTVLERVNARELVAGAIGEPAEVCVVDVSFISLRTIAPALVEVTTPDADVVLLVKPQFEAGRERVGRGGVVRDPAVHLAVLEEVSTALGELGLGVVAVVPSPIRGADGNVEFLARAHHGPSIVTSEDLRAAVAAAHDGGGA